MGIESQTTTVMEIPSNTFLDHWQGHRRLTRRLIEAFPEDKIFTYSIGGMRPFSDMVIEFLGMAIPGIRGMVTGVWKGNEWPRPTTKAELLQHWDEATAEINHYWPQLTTKRLLETDKAFGQWEGTVFSFLYYFIDNEIHHRGQGFVYLRSLGIEPPYFYDRN